MLLHFFDRIISHGVDDAMDQSFVNRIRRINLFYLILFCLLTISVIFALFTGTILLIILDTGFITGSLIIYFLIPANKNPRLNSMMGLCLLGLLFLSAFMIDFRVESSLILAFFMLFPLAAVSVNGKQGIYVAIGLGLCTIILNSLPGTDTFIHLKLFDAILFSSIYIIIIFLSLHIERWNRKLLSNLKESKSKVEDQVVERDEFISRLSHKLRTSLSNITLINNLVHDIRLTSEQMDLMETLRASTNNLIEDVNNIVEIASPGILDYKKSIISFDMTRVLEEALSILQSEKSSHGEISIDRSDHLNNFLIGDPSLVRSLVINIVKGLSIYKQTSEPVKITLETMRETPNQVRLEFLFTIHTELGEDLVTYLESMKRGDSHQGSNLANAFSLLQESESELIAVQERQKVILSFFQDFAKDATRTVLDLDEVRQKKRETRKSVALLDARVLLVEDNEINQKIVLLSLSKKVKKIDVARNGKEALEMFGLKQYDIILMDIMMPVMDGLTATKKIREIESTNDSHIPIITITANALAGDRDNCLAAGADDYIAKPFQAELLIKKMKNLLV